MFCARLSTCRADKPDSFIRAGIVDVRDDNLCSLPCQRRSGATSNAAGRARDYGDLPRKLFHFATPGPTEFCGRSLQDGVARLPTRACLSPERK